MEVTAQHRLDPLLAQQGERRVGAVRGGATAHVVGMRQRVVRDDHDAPSGLALRAQPRPQRLAPGARHAAGGPVQVPLHAPRRVEADQRPARKLHHLRPGRRTGGGPARARAGEALPQLVAGNVVVAGHGDDGRAERAEEVGGGAELVGLRVAGQVAAHGHRVGCGRPHLLHQPLGEAGRNRLPEVQVGKVGDAQTRHGARGSRTRSAPRRSTKRTGEVATRISPSSDKRAPSAARVATASRGTRR